MAIVAPENPAASRVLRRHRPGRQSRMPDLQAYLRATPGADPLAGNYVIVPQQDAILNFQGLSEQYALMAFTGQPGPPAALVETGNLLSGDHTAGKHLSVTTGDFNGDTLDEIASVCDDAGHLSLVLASNQDPALSSQSLSIASTTPLGSAGAGSVRIAAGIVADHAVDTLAIVWPSASGDLTLQIWGTDAALRPSLIAAATGSTPTGGAFDLALGDCDGDGQDEIVIAWQGPADPDGNTLFLQIWDLTTTGTLRRLADLGVAGLGGPFSVTTGSFLDLSVTIQIAVAWADASGHACVRLYALTDAGLAPCSAGYQNVNFPLAAPCTVRVASGDLDFDGVDELVLANVSNRQGYQTALALTVFQPDNQLNLHVSSQGTCGVKNEAFASLDTAIAIGTIGPAAFYGLVVDYAVSVDGSPSTYWGQNFSEPNATLNLPWATSSNPALQAMTRSIAFAPNTNGTVGVSARIGNYSLVPTTGITVQFFQGDPSGGHTIGDAIPISLLQPMERQNVSVTWQPPATPGTYQVWATVAPANPSGPDAFPATKGFANWTVSS